MRLPIPPISIAVFVLFVPAMAAGAWAVTLYQSDSFEDGTTEGWGSGPRNPNPPLWVPEGGPLGASDGFLRIEGNGTDTRGGNLVAFNTNQWTGDYLQAGVRLIRVDLKNLGAAPLTVRLLLEGSGGGFYSTAAASLPPGGAWQTARFTLEPETLTGGLDAYATLASVDKLRILHAPTPEEGPEPINGVLGVDNVTALSGDACLDANLSERAFGLCTAYCEALNCDGKTPRASEVACARLQMAFERATSMTPPCVRPDVDRDGVDDDFDNCPATPNSDQSDLDQDGLGDSCDNCPDDFNPEQEDSFGTEGVGDACDCPCFTVADASTIANDPTCDPICVLARPTGPNLTALQCSISRFDFSAVVVEFTDFGGEPLCQLNLPVAEDSAVVVGLTDGQVIACRSYVLEAAGANGLQCI